MNNLDQALAFVKRFDAPVFPVYAAPKGKHGAKAPLLQQDPFGNASKDEATIRNWWKRYGGEGKVAFAAYPGAFGFAVVDLDKHGDKEGEKSLLQWQRESGVSLPDTFEVTTPSGGRHLWYRAAGLEGGKDGWLEGVDVHGGPGSAGRYALLPAQSIQNGTYQITRKVGFADLPTAVVDSVNAARKARPETKALPGAPAEEADLLITLREIMDMAPIPQGRRDNTLYALACGWKERGVSHGGMLTLMSIMNDLGKLDDSDFTRICGSAWGKESAVFGSATLASMLPGEQSELRVRGYTAEEVMHMDVPEPAFLIDGILPEGLSVIGGGAKAGKTYLNLQLANALAAGGEFLGRKIETPKRVLYCYLEGGMGQVKKRLTELFGGNYRAPKNLIFTHQIPPLNAVGFAYLRRMIETHRADLVIIDTWQCVRIPGAEKRLNAYQQEYRELTELRNELIVSAGVSVLLTHHQKQMNGRDRIDALNTLSGSAAIGGAADCVLLLNRDRGADTAFLEIHGRDVEDLSLGLVKTEPMGWRVSAAGNSVLLIPETEFQRSIAEALRKFPRGATVHDVAEAIPGGGKYNSVLQQLKRWADDGRVDKVGKKYRLFEFSREEEGEEE